MNEEDQLIHELIRDKERLDWIETHQIFVVKNSIGRDIRPYIINFLGDDGRELHTKGTSLRNAVDSAMQGIFRGGKVELKD